MSTAKQALIAASEARLPTFELTSDAIVQKELALASSALIGKVTNADENTAAVEAMKRLKGISSSFESERKRLTEPLLDVQRQLKRTVDFHRDELDREGGRIENLVKEFVLEEQRRVREEEEAQRREIERIERERHAELQRIADEQARIDREAREAREAAERAAREATNKKQREAADKARREAEEKDRLARESAERARQESARIEENADLRVRIESSPIEITRAAGQVARKTWRIKQINDFQLMKARPDLVRRVEWDMIGIKEILNAGGTLPGVIAEEDLKVSTRGGAQKAIDV